MSDEIKPSLPSPRFEFVWMNDSGDEVKWLCKYSLVIPLREHDIRRGENDERTEIKLEIGSTEVTMGRPRQPVIENDVETPFRDGVHVRWDSIAFGGNVPVVAICGDRISRIAL